jgi:hypothetical protein
MFVGDGTSQCEILRNVSHAESLTPVMHYLGYQPYARSRVSDDGNH